MSLAFGALIAVSMLKAHQLLLVNQIWSRERFSMAATAFTANHMFQDVLHGSGGALCPYAEKRINLLRDANTNYWRIPFEELRFVHSADSNEARAVAKLAPHRDGRSKTSDVIIAPESSLPMPILAHDAVNSYFDLALPTNMKAASLAVACHGNLAALFQITTVSKNGTRAHYHSSSLIKPGNCALVFDPSGGCRRDTSHIFERGSLLIPYRPQAIYLALRGKDDKHYSLFRKRLVVANYASQKRAQMLREEWLQGISSLYVSTLQDANISGMLIRLGIAKGLMTASADISDEGGGDVREHTFTVMQ